MLNKETASEGGAESRETLGASNQFPLLGLQGPRVGTVTDAQWPAEQELQPSVEGHNQPA